MASQGRRDRRGDRAAAVASFASAVSCLGFSGMCKSLLSVVFIEVGGLLFVDTEEEKVGSSLLSRPFHGRRMRSSNV